MRKKTISNYLTYSPLQFDILLSIALGALLILSQAWAS